MPLRSPRRAASATRTRLRGTHCLPRRSGLRNHRVRSRANDHASRLRQRSEGHRDRARRRGALTGADEVHARAVVALIDGRPAELQLLYPDAGIDEPLAAGRTAMALTESRSPPPPSRRSHRATALWCSKSQTERPLERSSDGHALHLSRHRLAGRFGLSCGSRSSGNFVPKFVPSSAQLTPSRSTSGRPHSPRCRPNHPDLATHNPSDSGSNPGRPIQIAKNAKATTRSARRLPNPA